jgi:hypothetical protein
MRNLVQPPPSAHCSRCGWDLRLKLIEPANPVINLDVQIFICAKCGREQSYAVGHDPYTAQTASNMRPETETFSPETVRILGEALDEAWRRLEVEAGAYLKDSGDGARTLIAQHIIAMARQGERDRQRLIEGALARFRL